jgi:hypothetical protein
VAAIGLAFGAEGGLGKVRGDPLREKRAVMPDESNALVKVDGPAVSLDHSQVQGANPEFARLVFQKGHRSPPPAAVTICLNEIDFVNEGIAAEPLEAVAEADDCIADWRVTIEDDPCTPEVRILEKRDQSSAGLFAIITVAVKRIVIPHEVEKEFSIGGIRGTKLWAVRHPSHHVLERNRHPHPTADAESCHTLSGVALQHLVEERYRDASTCAADRVP